MATLLLHSTLGPLLPVDVTYRKLIAFDCFCESRSGIRFEIPFLFGMSDCGIKTIGLFLLSAYHLCVHLSPKAFRRPECLWVYVELTPDFWSSWSHALLLLLFFFYILSVLCFACEMILLPAGKISVGFSGWAKPLCQTGDFWKEFAFDFISAEDKLWSTRNGVKFWSATTLLPTWWSFRKLHNESFSHSLFYLPFSSLHSLMWEWNFFTSSHKSALHPVPLHLISERMPRFHLISSLSLIISAFDWKHEQMTKPYQWRASIPLWFSHKADYISCKNTKIHA